ncbi:hypothetical protein [Microbacterium sp. KNMS]
MIISTPHEDDPDPQVAAMYAHDLEADGLVFSHTRAMAVNPAARLSQDAASMTDDDSARLRAVGFSDRQIVDIALAAGARNLFSRTLQALAVPIEDVPRLSPQLSQALREAAERRGAAA